MKLFLLILLLPSFVWGLSEEKCIKSLSVVTQTSEEKVLEMLVECSNMFLKGQFAYLRQDASLTFDQKAEALIEYSLCEQISRDFKAYMKKCEDL